MDPVVVAVGSLSGLGSSFMRRDPARGSIALHSQHKRPALDVVSGVTYLTSDG
jgi:hypothetical protein